MTLWYHGLYFMPINLLDQRSLFFLDFVYSLLISRNFVTELEDCIVSCFLSNAIEPACSISDFLIFHLLLFFYMLVSEVFV